VALPFTVKSILRQKKKNKIKSLAYNEIRALGLNGSQNTEGTEHHKENQPKN